VLAHRWFTGDASAVGQARRFVAGVLGEDFPGLDDVLVLVSEVASNAVRHSASGDGGAFEVAVAVSGESVRVEVGDQGSGSEPRLADDQLPADVLTGGRGLRSWTCSPPGGGTQETSWAGWCGSRSPPSQANDGAVVRRRPGQSGRVRHGA
jgi:hypothetical protein